MKRETPHNVGLCWLKQHKVSAQQKALDVMCNYMRPFIIICYVAIPLLVLSCSSQKIGNGKYPDCSSGDIAKMDTCLLGMTLRQALNKLNIDTSQFHVIEEPIAALRGISFRPNDNSEVKLYVEKTLIKEKFDSFRLRDSLNFLLRDSLKSENRYLFIVDKPIKTVVWTKDAGATYKTVYVHEKE
jgi:hypothetical protein